MLVLKAPTLSEFMVKNSRFVAEALPASSPEEAREIWHAQKEKYHLNHIAYAFAVGPQGNIMGCSDDGEPSGTAGRPMLEVVKNCGLANLIVTGSRWFGGTKLGTGGLVKAYTACAQQALENAAGMELVPKVSVSFEAPYSLYEQIKLLLAGAEAEKVTEEFGSAVALSCILKESRIDGLKKALQELSSGKVTLSAVQIE